MKGPGTGTGYGCRRKMGSPKSSPPFPLPPPPPPHHHHGGGLNGTIRQQLPSSQAGVLERQASGAPASALLLGKGCEELYRSPLLKEGRIHPSADEPGSPFPKQHRKAPCLLRGVHSTFCELQGKQESWTQEAAASETSRRKESGSGDCWEIKEIMVCWRAKCGGKLRGRGMVNCT